MPTFVTYCFSKTKTKVKDMSSCSLTMSKELTRICFLDWMNFVSVLCSLGLKLVLLGIDPCPRFPIFSIEILILSFWRTPMVVPLHFFIMPMMVLLGIALSAHIAETVVLYWGVFMTTTTLLPIYVGNIRLLGFNGRGGTWGVSCFLGDLFFWNRFILLF